jgi:transcriptional regulator with XRE-family HTH domain/tetratricopeptide (TPR) repeat protein
MATARPWSFGDLLRRYRQAAGLTQEELAARARLSAKAIGALERGERHAPRRETLSLLADALHLTPAERALLEASVRRVAAPVAEHGIEPPGRVAAGPPLIGRVRDLARLERHLDGAGPPLLLLAGEPGIGKTRLLQEAMARAPAAGWTILAGGCNRRSGQEPYAPFIGALGHFLAARTPTQRRHDLQGCAWLARLLPELAESIVVPAPAWTLPPAQERRLMFAAFARVLANVAGPAGTLLALDDLHWAGADALDLLAFLLREPAVRPLRIIGAYRDTDVAPGDALSSLITDLARADLADRLVVAPLTADEAEDLLAALLPESGESALAMRQQVARRAGGIPFFLISCAQELNTDTLARDDGGDAARRLPWSAAESIRARVASLPRAAQHLLRVAAVAGHQTPRAQLLLAASSSAAADLSESEMLAALDAVEHARLLLGGPKGEYIFAHDLILETIAADLGAARRAALHRAVGEALEALSGGEKRAEELAYHFMGADEPARALPYALRAGDQAEAMFAHVEAEGYYRMAVDLAHEVGDYSRKAEALEKLGTIFDTLGRLGEAVHNFEQAASQRRAAGDSEGLAWVTGLLARACDRSGRQEQGIEHLRTTLVWLTPDEPLPAADVPLDLADPRADRALATLSPRLAARLGTSLGNYLVRLQRPGDAHVILTRAVERAHASEDRKVEATARLIRAFSLLELGRACEAETDLGDAARLAESAGDRDILAVALIDLAVAELYRGDLTLARRNGTYGSQVAEQLGDPEYTGTGAVALSDVVFIKGDWPQARDYLERAGEILRRTAPHVTPRALLTTSARLDLLQGGGEPCRAALERLAQIEGPRAPAAPNHHWRALSVLAESELLAGRADAAYMRLGRFLIPEPAAATLSAPFVASRLLPLLAWAIAERGDTLHAGELLNVTIERAPTRLSPCASRWAMRPGVAGAAA